MKEQVLKCTLNLMRYCYHCVDTEACKVRDVQNFCHHPLISGDF
jgi:hypothetical protein